MGGPHPIPGPAAGSSVTELMRYPDYMTVEDIAEFEMDMARFDLDPGMEFDAVNRLLREMYLDQLAAQSQLLGWDNQRFLN